MDVELLEFDPLPDELELLPPLDDFDDDDDDLVEATEARAANPDLLGSNLTLDDPDLLPPLMKLQVLQILKRDVLILKV